MRFTEQAADNVPERTVVARGEDIEPAIVIVIPGPARKADMRILNSHAFCNISEFTVTVIAEQLCSVIPIVDEEVGITIVVEVYPISSLTVAATRACDSGFDSDLFE